MTFLQLKTFCCCCCRVPVEKGARNIGIALAVMSVIAIVRIALLLVRFQAERDDPETPFNGILKNMNGVDKEASLENSLNALVFRLFLAVVCLIFSVMLVIGVNKANRCLVLSFLIYFGLQLATNAITLLVGFINPELVISEKELQQIRKEHDEEMVKVIMYLALVIILFLELFLLYVFVVVLSYYRELGGRREQHEFRQIPMV
ncbi:uncharacterized protein LOC119093277 [Pollicipes pollicipes]|uniref:uncharacterized protein LOC119093277 n=1 Tax=Pollicipes pollicipes TaxID=41117 RepID=UPI001884D268|nr:uncharacterized protein LOC119093277 [Pollicipes pollicipes]